jgi:hypothetical protein
LENYQYQQSTQRDTIFQIGGSMKKLIGNYIFICFTVFSLLILPKFIHAQDQNIKVVVENATVRMKPDAEGRIIANPLLGTVYNVKAKDGGWYEIRVRTEEGISITGYINEMFVQIVEDKKRPQAPSRRMELAFGGSYVSGYSVNHMYYSELWSAGLLAGVFENGKVIPEIGKAFGFDVSFNYFPVKDLGIQVRLDYNLKSTLTNASMSSFNLDFQWADGQSASTGKEWTVDGNITIMNISGNLIYKIPGNGLLAPFLSGGASYHSGKIKASTTCGYAWTWFESVNTDTVQVIDYIDIPANLNSFFDGIGFNIGGGADILFSSKVVLTIDARYFISKKAKEDWKIQAGEYRFNNFNENALLVDEKSANHIQEGIDPFELNPSYFKVSVGIKVLF